MSDVTLILQAARHGQPGAAERLWGMVYEELRRMAAGHMAAEGRVTMLQATALVHEAWLRLSGPEGETLEWDGRKHFFGAAAEAMRRILVEQARSRLAAKRGSGLRAEPLNEVAQIATPADERLLDVHEALEELARHDPRQAELVKLRFFVGLRCDEIAALLGTSERTVRREWTAAKTWLFRAITGEGGDSGPPPA